MNQNAMRNGQNKRMRGRNRKGQNPLTRVYESNGPDVKIRGTASHVAEKYVQLARDAQSSGDPVAAENYYQHAEHYFRLIAAVQEQFRQNQPFMRDGEGRGESYEEGEDDGADQGIGMGGEPFAPREQHYQQPREQQPFQQRDSRFPPREHGQQPYQGRAPGASGPADEQGGDPDRLPSFVTGAPSANGPSHPAYGQNGYEGGSSDRFPLHRRRRRRHGAPREGAPSNNEAADGNSRTPGE